MSRKLDALFVVVGALSAPNAIAQTIVLDQVPPITIGVSTTTPSLTVDQSSGNVAVRSFTGQYTNCSAIQDAIAGTVRTLSFDQVSPIALFSSGVSPSISIDVSTGNIRAFSAAGNFSSCAQSAPAGFHGKRGSAPTVAVGASGVLNVASNIEYFNRSVINGRRTLRFRLTQPFLCADFATPPAGPANPVGLEVIDPNLDSSGLLFGGISAYEYTTPTSGDSVLRAIASPQLACCVMLPAGNATCFQGTTSAAVIERIHANGFEGSPARQVLAGPDLLVRVNRLGAPGQYTVVVSNIGAVAASNVRVRDWFPKASGGFGGFLGTGSWACAASAGANCGGSSGTGNIAANAVSLNVGATVTFTVTRPVTGTLTESVSAAAFAPPTLAETNLSNNQSSVSF